MFVVGLLPTKIGSMERFFQYLAAALDRDGWDTVLCFDGAISAEFNEYFRKPYVTVERLDNQGQLGFACAGALWKLLRKHRPSIFVYAFHGVLRCFPWLARAAGSKRIFFNDHSSRPYGQIAAPLSLPKRIVGRLLTAPLTAIISVSEFTRKTGNTFGITSAPNMVVKNGVEVRPIDAERGSRFRQRFGIPAGDLLVTQICWMVEAKGVKTILGAASMLLQKRRGIHFLLIGDGEELPQYRRLAVDLGIAQSVTFTGILSNPTEIGVFDASDVYCQPSIWQEASGLAVLEAMSFKLPVVASNTGGLPDNVRHGQTGILVPVGEIDKLCAALEKLIDNFNLRKAMGEAGYQLVVQEHRIEGTIRKYVDIFLDHTPTAGA
jgi:glycosyltransferase involved in cell wall biosynthesis